MDKVREGWLGRDGVFERGINSTLRCGGRGSKGGKRGTRGVGGAMRPIYCDQL